MVGGGTPKASDANNFAEPGSGVPWITPADLTGYDEVFIGSGRRDLSPEGLEGSSARVLPKGTVLFSSRAPIGYCAVAANDIATNQGFKSLVLKSGLDPEFVRLYLLASTDYAELAASGTTFKELSGSRMKGLLIPVAPESEQRRIVARLDAIEAHRRAAAEKLARLPDLLDRYRQSVLAAAFRGDLTADWRAEHPDAEPASALLDRVRAERRRRWIADKAEKATARAEARDAKKGKTWTEATRTSRLTKESAKAEKKYAPAAPADAKTLGTLPDGWLWTTVDEATDILDSLRVPINARERAARIDGIDEDDLYPYYGATGQVGWIDDYLIDDDLVLVGEDGAPFLDPDPVAYRVEGKVWVNNHAHILQGLDGLSNGYLVHYSTPSTTALTSAALLASS